MTPVLSRQRDCGESGHTQHSGIQQQAGALPRYSPSMDSRCGRFVGGVDPPGPEPLLNSNASDRRAPPFVAATHVLHSPTDSCSAVIWGASKPEVPRTARCAMQSDPNLNQRLAASLWFCASICTIAYLPARRKLHLLDKQYKL